MATIQTERKVKSELLPDGTEQVLETESTVSTAQRSDEDAYIKLYTRHFATVVGSFTGVREKAALAFAELLPYMSYANPMNPEGGQLIVLNAAIRKQLADMLGVSTQQFARYLKDLENAQLIRKIAVNTYQANPHVVGRGDWLSIKRLRVTFDFIENTISTDSGEPSNQ